MEVRCPQCGTDYAFDERRVGARGVSVKCTACTHVFRVFPPSTSSQPWLVRHPDGSQVQFKDLTVLQRWIVEGRIRRADEISRSGSKWRALGDIAELEPFFRVYDDAEKLRQMQQSRGEPARRIPTTDVVRAMAPLEASLLDSSEHAVAPSGDLPRSSRDLPISAGARPVTLTQRRSARSTDLVVTAAPGFEASAAGTLEADEPETQPARPPPGAAFASKTLDFADGPPALGRKAPSRRGAGPLWALGLAALIVVAGAVWAALQPDLVERLFDRETQEAASPALTPLRPKAP
jgi:predicted Zn finger-like uncharacterized protein